MSIIGEIKGVKDRYSFCYGVSLSEGKYMVHSADLKQLEDQRERLLKIECSAAKIYEYYEHGYYKGRYESLKPVLEALFTRNEVFYTWHILDDWLWKLYEKKPGIEYFVLEIIRFFDNPAGIENPCRYQYRTLSGYERKIHYLEDCLDTLNMTEELCAIRFMKETGVRAGDLENVTWNNIHFPYVSGVRANKTNSLYPVGQISEETYELLQQFEKKDGRVFHKKREVLSYHVRRAIGDEFEFGIHELRGYWRERVIRSCVPGEEVEENQDI